MIYLFKTYLQCIVVFDLIERLDRSLMKKKGPVGLRPRYPGEPAATATVFARPTAGVSK